MIIEMCELWYYWFIGLFLVGIKKLTELIFNVMKKNINYIKSKVHIMQN